MKLLTAILNNNILDYIGYFTFEIKDIYATLGADIYSGNSRYQCQ